MARPDPTPPDASLFPIAPAFTADLDGKALDEIQAALDRADAYIGHPPYRAILDEIRAALLSTGRRS